MCDCDHCEVCPECNPTLFNEQVKRLRTDLFGEDDNPAASFKDDDK